MQQQFSDHSTDSAFRNKLGKMRVEPRKRVWYRISAELDREASAIAHKRRRIIGFVISGIIIIAIALTAIVDPVATRKRIFTTEGSLRELSQNVNSKTDNRIVSDSKNNFQATSSLPNKDLNPGIHQKVLISDNLIGNIISKFENEILPIASSRKIVFSSDNESLLTHEFLLSMNSNPVKNCFPKKECPKFYVECSYGIHSTSFLDSTASSFLNYENRLKTGSTVMIKAGYNLNRNFSFELGCNIFSHEGEKYSFANYARSNGTRMETSLKEISITYTEIPVRVVYNMSKWSGLIKSSIGFSVFAGGHYGRITNVSETLNEVSVGSKLKKNIVATDAGIGLNISLSKHWAVTQTASVSFSNNVFMDNQHFSPFSSPHLFNSGIALGVRYNFCN